ncbi:MAG TPA: META domain-containing protein [Acidimicrobiales bacterium]
MTSAVRLLAIVVTGVVLAACGGGDEPVTAGDGSTTSPGQLLAAHYVSAEVTEGGASRPLVPGTQIDLRFDETTIGMSLGCNSMSGTYRLEGDVLVVDGGLATTEMGCDPPRHVQDQWFADLIASRPTVQVEGDELTMTSSESVVRFLDREVAEPDRGLVGTTWHVDGFADGDDPQSTAMSSSTETPATVLFREDGFVTGGDGCNGFGLAMIDGVATDGLRYEVDGAEVRFSADAPQTGVACPDLDDHLDRFWAALSGTATFSIDGDRLRLVGEDGRIMALRATD